MITNYKTQTWKAYWSINKTAVQALQPFAGFGLYVTNNGDGLVWTSHAANYRLCKVTLNAEQWRNGDVNVDGFCVNPA